MNWNHLLALIQLRLQLSRNQQIKVSKLNYFLTKIAFGLIAVQAIISFLAVFGLSCFFLADNLPGLAYFWHLAIGGLLFYWVLMLAGQMQLTETISIEKLLHLPVSLRGAFLLNFVSSFSNSAVWLCFPVVLGITAAAIVTNATAGIGLLTSTLAILFLLTSLTFLFRSWISRLVRNRRTKATLALVVPFAIFLSMAILFYDFAPDSAIGQLKQNIKTALKQSSRQVPSWKFSLATFLIGIAGLFLAYQNLVRQYMKPTGRRGKASVSKGGKASYSNVMNCRVPFVSQHASVVAMATLKNILRSPEILAASAPLVLLIIAGFPYAFEFSGYEISDALLPWIPVGIITVVLLAFPSFVFSLFSYDRGGFRAFILSPISRRDVLIGKNVGVGVLTMLSGVVLLAVAQFFFTTSVLVFLSNLVNLVAAYLLCCIVGNLLSVYCPIGLKRGTMQPTNAPFLFTVFLYLGILVTPFLVVQPAMTAVGIGMLANYSFTEINGPVYLLYSALIMTGAATLYWLCLAQLEGGLWRQQPNIVQVVSHLPE